MNDTDKLKEASKFAMFLINRISKRILNDEQCTIVDHETEVEYGIKEYISIKMKKIFDLEIKWNDK